VPLFIDRLSFHCWTDNTRNPPKEHWSIVLPVVLTEAGLSAPPPTAKPYQWVFDTGNRGEAFAWRQHLLDAGLNPDVERPSTTVAITSAFGDKEAVPVRWVLLWLQSNLPALEGQPYRLELPHGLPFRDVPTLPDPQFHRPVLGMRPLLRARVRVELDFAARTLSLWTPEPP
jgi:hypothetical protein